MGLKYSPSESQDLMTAMAANIQTTNEIVTRLNQASSHLVSALSNGTLSGAAYNAGKGMFSDIVIPTIKKASSSLDSLQSELSRYKSADSEAGGELLDEDKLNEHLNELKSQKAATQSMIDWYKDVAGYYKKDNPLHSMFESFAQSASGYMGTIEDDIRKVEEKLKKLHAFNGAVGGLFVAAQEDFEALKQGMAVIGAVAFSGTGSFVIGRVNDGLDLKGAIIQYKNGKAFLGNVSITRDSEGRLKWGKKFIQNPSNNHIYGYGRKFEEMSGIDLSKLHYSLNADGSVNWKELKAAGLNGTKMGIKDIAGDFKCWKNVSTVGEGAGKFLGAAGTVITIGTDAKEDFKNVDWSDGSSVAGATGNFVVDAGVDLGAGAAAAGAGAAIGSFFLPPLGTVVGAAAGVGVNWLLSEWKVPGLNESVTDAVKDGVKNVANSVGQAFSHTFW